MSQPPQQPRRIPSPRARGTAPLDGFVASSGALPLSETAPLDAVIHREGLQGELAQAEKLVSTMRLRVRALERAVVLSGTPPEVIEGLFAGVSEYERAFTHQIAKVLAESPDRLRRARIVITQFQGAERALEEAAAVYEQFLAGGLAVGKVEGFSLSKFKGSLYPLYNFATAFAGLDLLGDMFPPMRPPVTQSFSPSAGYAAPNTPPDSAQTPAGSLLDRGFGWFKKAQDAVDTLRRLKP